MVRCGYLEVWHSRYYEASSSSSSSRSQLRPPCRSTLAL